MKAKLFFSVILAGFAVSCATATEPSDYTLKVNLSPDEDGMMVYITDYDSGNKIDSAIVENGIALFKGKLDTTRYARLLIEGSRIGDIFLEPADIVRDVETRSTQSDGTLNKKFEELNQKLNDLKTKFAQLSADSANRTELENIYNRYNTTIRQCLEDNIDNALGYMLFIETISGLDIDELNSELAKHPQFKDSKRVKKQLDFLRIKEETSVGHKYKDFTITNGEKVQKLSDYVGNDHYTLVDFWASWCGPCIRETAVIKKLYEKYNGKGLEFLGVAVWDKPEDTKTAIEKHSLPWNMIINAQTIPTDLYGILGIPCIILIAPDGTIVSRDKQDEELIADVDAAMEAFNKSKGNE